MPTIDELVVKMPDDGVRRTKRTRGQGRDPANFPALRLLGERLCLHFANTVESRIGDRPEEYLRGYADLAGWGWHSGALSASERQRLLAEAERRPDEAAAVFDRAMALRDAIHRVFRAIAHDQVPMQPDLDRLHGEYVDALARARLAPEGGGYDWSWAATDGDLDRPLWPVARSAVKLLTEEDLGRVKECPGAGDCGWLFYDTSKNASRRWCSMEGCGSRVKMRRLYARNKAARADGE